MPVTDVLNDPFAKQLLVQAVPRLFTDVRFNSAFTGEVVVLKSQDVIDLIEGTQRPETEASRKAKEALAVAKPSLVVNSPVYGPKVWAPYGIATAAEADFWRKKLKFWVFGGAAALFAIGFTLGRISKKGVYDNRADRGAFGRG